jgi:hypothetical protein
MFFKILLLKWYKVVKFDNKTLKRYNKSKKQNFTKITNIIKDNHENNKN